MDGQDGLHFTRGGWTVVTSFAKAPSALPPGEVVLSSAPLLDDRRIGPDTTVWILAERT